MTRAFDLHTEWLQHVVFAWLLVLAARLISVGGEWQSLDTTTWVSLGAWLLLYVIGYLSAIPRNLSEFKLNMGTQDRALVNRCVLRLSVIAMLGAAFIAYEFAVIRGYGFKTSVATIRMAEVENARLGFEGSSISGIGRLLTPALLVAWLLTVVCWYQISIRSVILVCISTAAVVWQQVSFEGGRFFIGALLISVFVARRIAIKNKFPIKTTLSYMTNSKNALVRFLRIAIALIAPLLIVGFGYVFIARAEDQNTDLITFYLRYNTNFAIDVPLDITSRFDDFFGAVWFGMAMLWHYATQGPNELNNLLLTENLSLAYGLFQFPQIGQALSKLTDISYQYDAFANLPNPGTYLTFYGASYIDFGHAGALVFSAMLGATTSIAVATLSRGNLHGLGLCAPILATISLISPIVSLMTNLWPAIIWALFVGRYFR